jgi:NADPH-dependent 2,4-dienoyl-CoA reductase/sulfur reductase-like enzyme
MSTWYEYIQKDAPIPRWPYPIRYGQEKKVSADVLILGGGVAGCHAAISAVKRGAKVVVVDKGPLKWSGYAGGGVDHWHGVCSNPCCKITAEEMARLDQVTGYEMYSLRPEIYRRCDLPATYRRMS